MKKEPQTKRENNENKKKYFIHNFTEDLNICTHSHTQSWMSIQTYTKNNQPTSNSKKKRFKKSVETI